MELYKKLWGEDKASALFHTLKFESRGPAASLPSMRHDGLSLPNSIFCATFKVPFPAILMARFLNFCLLTAL